MPKNRSRYPTELELEILKILWESSPLSVREVRETMAKRGRSLAHTSLITTLNVMHEKGFVSRAEAGRGYAFAPIISHDQVSQGMVGDLVTRVFDGSASALMLSLLENESIEPAERDALRSAIENHRTERDHDDR